MGRKSEVYMVVPLRNAILIIQIFSNIAERDLQLVSPFSRSASNPCVPAVLPAEIQNR
jgi:hypothetical protein